MSDARPNWEFGQLTEAKFRKMESFGMIVSVTARHELTSADTAKEWLEVRNRDGKTMKLPENWRTVWEFKGYASNPGLFGRTYIGDKMWERLYEIDRWEKKNEAERAEYERLKAKFSPTPTQ